jgi:outer membrane protein assembly factor BamB
MVIMKKLLTLLLTLFFLLVAGITYAQTPKILWWFDTHDMAAGQSAIGDIDQDGKYEIVFGCYRNDSMIYALNAEDGTLLWKYNAAGAGDGCNDVAVLIYDVTGDGKPEVIVPSSCHPRTFCFRGNDGSVLWQTITRGSDSPPVIADLQGNGNLEILHGEFGGWVRSINALTGATNWDILVDANSWVQTAPTIVDLNNNGQLDFVVGTWGFSNNSRFYAYEGNTRNLLWSIPLDGYSYHGTGVADLNGDGFPNLVIGDYSGKLHVLNGNTGTYLWSFQGPGYIGSPPAIADINGDGHCEIVITSGSRVIALDRLGNQLWQFTMSGGGSCFRGVALADITNDSLPEVIFGSTNGSVYALKGTDGSLLWTMDLQAHYGSTLRINHAPVIADFTGNDTLDMFVVGGYAEYPNIQVNYGRGYAIQIGKGTGPEWKMFQRDYYRSCSYCYPGQIIGTGPSIPEANPILFNVHPIPVRKEGVLHLSSNPDVPYLIEIFDLTGKQILSTDTPGDISIPSLNLGEGVYLIRCTNAYGRSIRKFTVVR